MRELGAARLSCLRRQLPASADRPTLSTRQFFPGVSRSFSHDAASFRGGVPTISLPYAKLPSRKAGLSLSRPAQGIQQREFGHQAEATSGNRSIALFQEIVNDQKAIGKYRDGIQDGDSETVMLSEAADLKQKLESGDCDPHKLVNDVLDRMIPRLRRHKATSEIDNVRRIMRDYQEGIVQRKCQNVRNQPSAARTISMFAELDLPVSGPALDLITSSIQELVCEELDENMSPLPEYENALGLREFLLNDVLSTWRIFCYPEKLMPLRPIVTDGESNSPREFQWPPKYFHFPPKLSLKIQGHSAAVKPGQIDGLLKRIFPRVKGPSDLAKLRTAVIATYSLLTDSAVINKKIQADAKDFLGVVGAVLEMGRMGKDHVKSILRGYPGLCIYVLQRWDQLPEPDPAWTGRSHSSPGTSPKKSLADHHQLVSKALSFRWVDEATQLWRAFKSSTKPYTTHQPSEDTKNMFDYYVFVFMVLGSPTLAMEVWNHMISLGIRPSIKSWTAMLQGCKCSGTPSTIENVWFKMKLSGTPPDVHAWTTRISGLASQKAFHEALVALDEMFAEWEAEPRNPSAVQPTIAQVNAILSAMATHNKINEARKLVAWAKAKKMQPDAFTYNTIIGVASRHGRTGDVAGALSEMVDAGIPANEATFTLVFNELLGKDDVVSAGEQRERILKLLDDMEEHGVQPNLEVYGKIIYLSLRRGSEGEETVKAVLNRLSADGLTRSPHIYAMLVDYYFNQVPSDIQAVRNLITTRELGIKRPMRADKAFWERIIKGYAECDEVDDAVDTWNDLVNAPAMSELEQPVSLNVAVSLLKALLRRNDIERAREIVATMETWAREHRRADASQDRRFWGHRFWHQARVYGLMRGGEQAAS